MDEAVRQQLLEINRNFYAAHAAAFAATRTGAQPGWERLLACFPPSCRVLDLGCGNGRFASFLDERLEQVAYVGLDGSAALIDLARQQTRHLRRTRAEFRCVDMAQTGWGQGCGEFDAVVALAVLHHLPGFGHRADFLAEAARCLSPTAVLILSNWRFTHTERLRRKIVPWDRVHLSAADVEAGDFLLDWRRQGLGYRYAHQLDEAEIEGLASAAGLSVVAHFYADGREGDLSLYSLLQRK